MYQICSSSPARSSPLGILSGVTGMSETEHLPNSPPLAGESESRPKVRVLEFVGVEQRQLGFTPGFRAGLAGVPAPDEFRHQLAGGLVTHFPMARQHGLGAGDAEGPPQGHHALANLHLARPLSQAIFRSHTFFCQALPKSCTRLRYMARGGTGLHVGTAPSHAKAELN